MKTDQANVLGMEQNENMRQTQEKKKKTHHNLLLLFIHDNLFDVRS